MAGEAKSRLKEWLDRGEAQLHPLTYPQRELWEASVVPPEDVANHICAFIRVRGVIAPEDCARAIQKVVDRQEVLRLSFLPGKERPLQLVRAASRANAEFRDLRSGEEPVVEAEMDQIFRAPFDLVKGPLYRVVMLRVAPDDIYLVFAIHHAIADGWSLGVFVQDLVTAYIFALAGSPDPLPLPAQTHSAWGASERGIWSETRLAEHAQFWKVKFAGARKLWPHAAPRNSHLLERMVFEVDPDLTSGVRNLARKAGATFFSTLFAGFQIAVANVLRVREFTVGTPVANRSGQAVKETMGYFSGTIPLRCHVTHNELALEFVRAVHRDAVEAFAHPMPFAELVKAVQETPHDGHPLYDVRFALQNHPIPDASVPGLSVKLHMRSTGTARFDLGCEVTEEGSALEVVWLFHLSRISRVEVEELHRAFREVLASACGAQEPAGVTTSSRP
jgi:hypothetical protein